MKKIIIKSLWVALVVVICGFIGIICNEWYTKQHRERPVEEMINSYAGLDHDIYVSEDSTRYICNETLTGWDASCGPSPAGWPMAFPFKWEVYLVESNNYYFARLIYHEYVLWMSFDYPYVLIKIPKSMTTGNWATNKHERMTALWDITNEYEHGWDNPDCIEHPQCYIINGHTVNFGGVDFRYEKYQVVSDANHPW